jgi:hypothetical protein
MTDSIYDQLNAYGTVAKQRFVENFSGDALDTDRWTQQNITGTNTFAMADVVDGGFSIKTASTASARADINFNDKRQYDIRACVGIFVIQAIEIDQASIWGFYTSGTASNFVRAYDDHNSANFGLQCNDGTSSATDTGLATDGLMHVHKIECGASNAKLTIDGVLKATHTTNRPTSQKSQPTIDVVSQTTSAVKETRIRYVECYNT